MSNILELVLECNDKFYSALSDGNLELMESVWLHDDKVKCVHPGWDMVKGWDAVKESWDAIFFTGGPLEVRTSNVELEVCGKIAMITCVEHISHKVGSKIRTGFALATNFFERNGDKWFMIHHHASPVPGRGLNDENIQ
ncbi:MAG: nuclear transport factor 2 family protein [Candidatus Dadabacteria bacterium]|nr:nuclear transport factor 2 family protein [Candidatus Dadabacteria bacterium]